MGTSLVNAHGSLLSLAILEINRTHRRGLEAEAAWLRILKLDIKENMSTEVFNDFCGLLCVQAEWNRATGAIVRVKHRIINSGTLCFTYKTC